MTHYKIDATYFLPILSNMPKEIVFEIMEYGYNKCCECKHYLLKEYTCSCGATRCEYHGYLNMKLYECLLCRDTLFNKFNAENDRVYINCIIPNCYIYANYGYKDIVCYCEIHCENKKVIHYQMCDMNCSFKTCYRNIHSGYALCKYHRQTDKLEHYELNYINK